MQLEVAAALLGSGGPPPGRLNRDTALTAREGQHSVLRLTYAACDTLLGAAPGAGVCSAAQHRLTPDQRLAAAVHREAGVTEARIKQIAEFTASQVPAATPEMLAAVEATAVVKYSKGMYGADLDARDAAKWPKGTAVGAMHHLFSYPPAALQFVHIDNAANGFAPGTSMQVTAFNGQAVSLGTPQQPNLALMTTQIGVMDNLRCLYLRNAGLRSISFVKAPHLRQLDVSNNQLQDIGEIIQLAQRSPNLILVNIMNNPVCRSWGSPFPPSGNTRTSSETQS